MPQSSSYDLALHRLVGGGSTPAPTTASDKYDLYDRPSEWPTIDSSSELPSGTSKAILLHAVFDHSSNYAALLATVVSGNFTVDWGDGTSSTVAGGSVAYHQYTYSSGSLTSTSYGYKVAKVTVTGATSNLRGIDLTQRHTSETASGPGGSCWLDCKMRSTSTNTLTISSTSTGNKRAAMLERFEFLGTSASLSLQNCFSQAGSLIACGISNMTISSLQGTFQGCGSLKYLDTINIGNLPASSSFSSTFSDCSSIENITFTGTNGTLTSAANMFSNCYALKSVPTFSTSGGTTFPTMFSNCYSLKTIPTLNTSSGTSFTSFINGCRSLQVIPALNFAGWASTWTMSTPPLSVSRILATFANNQSITLTNFHLGSTELDEVYTNLPTASGTPVITVTGNPGTTADTPSIATAKGWTVTG